MNAFLLLFGGGSRRLNVTRYSNAPYTLSSTYSGFFSSLHVFLSVVLNRSQMVELETIQMLLLLVNSAGFLCVCAYVCHVCFDLMRSSLLHLFYGPILCSITLSLPLYLSLFFLQLAILSRVLCYYSCYCLWCGVEP